MFLPSLLDQRAFYLSVDDHYLAAQLRSELAYVHEHWREPGRPTMALLLTRTMLQLGQAPVHESPLLALIKELLDGRCELVPVKVGPLSQLVVTSASERIEGAAASGLDHHGASYALPATTYLADDPAANRPLEPQREFEVEQEGDREVLLQALRASTNLHEQLELLAALKAVAGLDDETGLGGPGQPVTVRMLLEEVYGKASRAKLWAPLRRASELLAKADITLSDAVTELLVRQKRVAVGKAYSSASVIREPLPHTEIVAKIRAGSGGDARMRVLAQELLIGLSVLIKSEPQLFEGLMTLRVGYLVLLIVNELARETALSQTEAYERLMTLSPFEVQLRLRQVLAGYEGLRRATFQRESLHARAHGAIDWGVVPATTASETLDQDDWCRKRQIDGEIIRLPEGFYSRVWGLLEHCRGLVIGSKLERRNRIDSARTLSETTPGEQNFARRIDHLLSKIQAPEYRHLTVEALQELAEIFGRNPDLAFDDDIVVDVLIGHAVRLCWLDHRPERRERYEEDKAAAWRLFYESPPAECARCIGRALEFLAELGDREAVASGEASS